MSEYGGLFKRPDSVRVENINDRIEKLIRRGVNSPREHGKLAKLMAIRDQLIAREAARKGAAMASAGQIGGIAGSGIRGVDVIEQEFTPEVIRQHNVEGAAQGSRATFLAPPGSGRLVTIPFVVSGATTPVQAITGGSAAIGSSTNLVTQAVNWAILKIVAFTCQSAAGTTGSFAVVQDLKIGGSPNLFLTEDWILADEFDVDREAYAGLRAYPYLVSPNTASLTVAAYAPAAQTVYLASSLVCDVIRDDAFGPGLPGPYAR
jgi:hypothetical protein